MMPRGIGDGATAVRFLGVMRKAKVLKSDLPDKKLRETVAKANKQADRKKRKKDGSAQAPEEDGAAKEE